jgi:hypothetical protein
MNLYRNEFNFGVARPDVLPWAWRPTCAILLAVVAICTLLFGLLNGRNMVTGDFTQGIVPRRLLREWGVLVGVPGLLVGSLTCLTMGELVLFSAIVVFAGFEVERLIGSHRFFTFLVLCWVIRIPMLLAMSTLLGAPGPWYALAPSIGWLGVALAVARRTVSPPVREFVVFGVPMCDQTSTDFLALQMALIGEQNWVRALFCGAVVACIAMSDILGLFRSGPWQRPAAFARLLSRKPNPRVVFHPLPTTTTSTTGGVVASATEGAAIPQQHPQRTSPAARRESPQVPVLTPQHIAALVDLGFSDEQARVALQRANGDVNRASAMLLDGDIPHM